MAGEVWICSGQSNMEMPVKGFNGQPVKGSSDIILGAKKTDNIRMFNVGKNSSDTPLEDCRSGQWQCSDPNSVADCSATAYFFGQALDKSLDIPIGLIVTSWGGSSIETWIDNNTISEIPNLDMDAVNKRTRQNQKASLLYNGMLNPIVKYAAKGFIWYQGESNIDKPEDYDKLMVSLVGLWRKRWNNPEMPFYYVQIAPYRYKNAHDISCPLLIEAQYKAKELITKSGIAATTDVGNEKCIHPCSKKEVGERLAFMALKNDYSIDGLPNDAPRFESMKIDGNKVYITLSNVDNNGNSIVSYGEDAPIEYQGFEIAGDDKVFYPAKASNKNNQIKLEADSVKSPVAVRYGFRNYIKCNVKTNLGQPLVPFRTDDW